MGALRSLSHNLLQVECLQKEQSLPCCRPGKFHADKKTTLIIPCGFLIRVVSFLVPACPGYGDQTPNKIPRKKKELPGIFLPQ